jgi:NAD(P)-dependent dehydrogenase (short-subunit alcohol dehydrogenase family)
MARRWPAGRCWSPGPRPASDGQPRSDWPDWALRSPLSAGTARTHAVAGEIATAGGRVEAFVADLSCQAQVRRLAGEVLGVLPRIHVLVSNVGGYRSTRHVTADRLERTFVLNHLAPFLLTNLLLDWLQHSATARVVIVASHAHNTARIDFDDLQGARSYSGGRAYGQSKLANLLFTYHLAKTLQASSVTANALLRPWSAQAVSRSQPRCVGRGPTLGDEHGAGRFGRGPCA